MNNDSKEILEKNGVLRVTFQEVKNPLIGVLFIVCTFISKTGSKLARGISVCSLKDCFKRKEGRDKAFERAKIALISKESSDEIRNYRPDILTKRTIILKNPEESMEFLEGIIPYIKLHKKDEGKQRYEVSIRVFYPLEMAYACGLTYKSEYEPNDDIDLSIMKGLIFNEKKKK